MNERDREKTIHNILASPRTIPLRLKDLIRDSVISLEETEKDLTDKLIYLDPLSMKWQFHIHRMSKYLTKELENKPVSFSK